MTDSTDKTFLDVVYQRRSTRGYLDKPIPTDLLEKIFSIAQQAPSNCNIQPWKVFVASGESRDRVREALIQAETAGEPNTPDYPGPGKFAEEYRRRQVDCAVELYNAMGIAREDKEGRARASLRNQQLFDAPHAAFIGMHNSFGPTVAVDVGMYAQTLMLTMTAFGIASCAQGSLRYRPQLVREILEIPDDINLLFGISFGYEDTSIAANTTRVGRDDISQSVVFKS